MDIGFIFDAKTYISLGFPSVASLFMQKNSNAIIVSFSTRSLPEGLEIS